MSDTPPLLEFRPIDRSRHELLIVDDNPASRYATARLLQSAGFRIREAATGAEGLRAANDAISAIVLDIHLPDIDGFELCRRLRSRPETSRLPVLHLTAAYVTDDDKVRGLDSGADAYLTHPVEPAVLIATVQALVRTRVAEEGMRRSEAKFRAIYAQAPGGICLLDDDGRIVDANPAMLALLRRDLPAVEGHRLGEFVPADRAAVVDAATRPVPRGDVALEFPLVDPDGGEIHCAWRMSADVEPGLHMAVATDISQRVQLEQQRQALLDSERVARGVAERMNRMKDDLIAVLSHELRTPLNAIMGWSHVLQKRGGPPETMQGLAAIERNGLVQARMISDILDMSSLNLGKLHLELRTVDPAQLLASAIDTMRPAIQDGEHPLDVEVASDCPPVRADASRLQQVIWNLLSNAVKFSPDGGPIRVALAPDAGGALLTVSDQGEGIAPDFLPYLFDRFMQSDAGSNRHRRGLGLGLSIVKQLVEAHGGHVSASSAGLGQGTTLRVWLPADTAPSVEAAPPAVHATGAAVPHGRDDTLDGVRLLVVDDDPGACAMLQIVLADRGADVRLAHDYDAALAALAESRPDVLISDVGMPHRDGYELMREVRRREAASGDRVPAIALTSFNREQDRRQSLEAGFDAHCSKPLQPLQLVQEILRLAATRRGRGRHPGGGTP